jgi:integrase
MPRRPAHKVKDTKKGFLVHIPASQTLTGKLERRYFEKENDALKFAQKLSALYHKGLRGGMVTGESAQSVSTAEKIISDSGFNVTVVEAVRAYLDARSILDPYKANLAAVLTDWQKARKARGDDRTFAEAAAEFIKEKEMGWSSRYVKNIDQTMKVLPQWFLDMKLPDIHDKDMLRATKESVKTPTAIDTRMRHIKSLCAGKGKKKRGKKIVVILTPKQCAAMLRACDTKDEIRAVSLLLFAGIRPDATDGEISRLDWSAIKGGEIHVPAEVSKTDTERIIPIRPRLARLIKGHSSSGAVMPSNWKKRIGAIRKAAGMNTPEYQDATRHCYASHHLVAYGETSTQAAMGHTEGSRTLFKHYRAAVTEEAAKKYFGKYPVPSKAKNQNKKNSA